MNNRIRELRLAAGLSQEALGEYVGGTKAQISKLERGDRQLTQQWMERIAKALTCDVGDLLNAPLKVVKNDSLDNTADIFQFDPAPINRILKDTLPVLGVGMGTFGKEGFFELNGSVVDHIERPSMLHGAENAYAIFLVGESMEPKYQEGQTLFIHPDRPARKGDFVVVQFNDNRAIVKRMGRRDDSLIHLEQFNPPKSLSFDLVDVKSIHKIVGAQEG